MRSASQHSAVEQLPTQLFHTAAQEVYSTPTRTLVTVSKTFDKVAARNQQTGMREHRPVQADYLEMRTVWNALAAPLLHGVELKLLEEMLPSIKNGTPLVQPNNVESDLFDHTFTREYTGTAVTFLRAMAPLGAAAAEKFVCEVESDGNHWYRPIWDAFCNYHWSFCLLEQRVDRGLNRSIDPADSIVQLGLDSETVYALLEPAQRHFSIWGNEWAENKKQGLVAAAEQLSWAASTKRNLVAKYMGRKMRPKICPFAHAPLSTPSDDIWNLKMLIDGKQEPPGFCPANVVLQSPLQHDHDLVEDFYSQVREVTKTPHRLDRAYGASSVAELRTHLAAFALSELPD